MFLILSLQLPALESVAAGHGGGGISTNHHSNSNSNRGGNLKSLQQQQWPLPAGALYGSSALQNGSSSASNTNKGAPGSSPEICNIGEGDVEQQSREVAALEQFSRTYENQRSFSDQSNHEQLSGVFTALVKQRLDNT